jgi:hypothetical protein
VRGSERYGTRHDGDRDDLTATHSDMDRCTSLERAPDRIGNPLVQWIAFESDQRVARKYPRLVSRSTGPHPNHDRLKTATDDPIPTTSVMTAAVVSPGLAASLRAAWRVSAQSVAAGFSRSVRGA